MDFTATLTDILKYTIPALIVLAACYMIVDKFLVAEYKRKQMAIFKDTQDVTLRLRLQAYERMVMFAERISPRQLIPRVYESEMTVRDLQTAIVLTIKAEFEHNLSQQIYLSSNVWQTVVGVKEQELNMVNHLARTLNPDAPAHELHMRILEVLSKNEDETPTEVALKIIHDEATRVMTYGTY
jgi:hypothetical protein